MDREIYELDRRRVIENVKLQLIGNYWLGSIRDDGTLHTKYVGRSTKWDNRTRSNGLQKRLLDWASKGKYSHFCFRPSGSIPEIFNVECREFHLLRDQLDNIRHPDSPRALGCVCQYCERSGRRRNGRSMADGGDAHA
mgnify:CR=1 FL=1